MTGSYKWVEGRGACAYARGTILPMLYIILKLSCLLWRLGQKLFGSRVIKYSMLKTILDCMILECFFHDRPILSGLARTTVHFTIDKSVINVFSKKFGSCLPPTDRILIEVKTIYGVFLCNLDYFLSRRT